VTDVRPDPVPPGPVPPEPVRFAVVGLDHAHVNGQIAGLVGAGAVFVGRAGPPSPVHDAVAARWPDVPLVPDSQQLLDDPSVDLVVTAAVPPSGPRSPWPR